MSITVPPVRTKGNDSHVADHNLLRQAALDLQSQIDAITGGSGSALADALAALADRMDDAEAAISALQARPTYVASTTEPTHDGSQRDGDGWVVKSA